MYPRKQACPNVRAISSTHHDRVAISSPAISSNLKSDATPKSQPAASTHQASSATSSSDKDTTNDVPKPEPATASAFSSVSAASVVTKAGAWLSATSATKKDDYEESSSSPNNEQGVTLRPSPSPSPSPPHDDAFSMLEGPLNDEPRAPRRPTAVSYECSHLTYFAALDEVMFNDDDDDADDDADDEVVVNILQGIQDRLLARHLRNGTLATAEGRTAEDGTGGTAECRTFPSFGRKRRFGQIDRRRQIDSIVP